MEVNPELRIVLHPYDEPIQDLVFELRKFILDTIPDTNELIWDNYNAVAIAYSKSEKLKDAFCHIAVYAKHVNFGFNRGAELSKGDLKLEGKGKLIRHLKVKIIDSFPKQEVKKMIYEAVGLSDSLKGESVAKNRNPKSIVMSISEKKIRPKNN